MRGSPSFELAELSQKTPKCRARCAADQQTLHFAKQPPADPFIHHSASIAPGICGWLSVHIADLLYCNLAGRSVEGRKPDSRQYGRLWSLQLLEHQHWRRPLVRALISYAPDRPSPAPPACRACCDGYHVDTGSAVTMASAPFTHKILTCV